MFGKNFFFGIMAGAFLIIMGAMFLTYKYFSEKTTSKIEINTPENLLVSEEIAEATEPGNDIPENIETEKALAEIAGSKKIEESKSAASVNGKISITSKLMDSGYQKASGRKIDTIIIHSSYNSLGGDEYSVDKIIDIYKSYGVSAHYLIDRKGKIYQLVENKNIAYHAGAAKLPDGRINVNEVSIGIELINNKTEKFTESQYKALNSLLSSLKSEYKIKYVLGHNQIAPGRKDDPWNFSWDKIGKKEN